MRKCQVGITLPELVIVITIISILAAVAVPSFARMIERNKIKEAAEGLRSDMHWARTLAVKQSDNVSIVFTTGNSWQYVVSSSSGTIKTVSSTDSAITMSSTVYATNTVSFSSRRGGTNSGYVVFATTNYQLRVQTSSGYVIEICNPVSANAVSGYESC